MLNKSHVNLFSYIIVTTVYYSYKVEGKIPTQKWLCDWLFERKVLVCDSFFRKPISIVFPCYNYQPLTKHVSIAWWQPKVELFEK